MYKLKNNLTFRFAVLFVLVLSLFAGSQTQVSGNSADPPTTGFEDREGESRTTHEEELAFLETISNASDRMTYSIVGESVEGRPIHLVRVGYPEPPSDEAISEDSSILVIGSQHGNEPAGREMALQLLRDLAFTEDPDLLDQLSDTTVMFIPSANPDGIEADIRANSLGIDPNRDHINLMATETRVMAQVLQDFKPEITIDAHEGPSTPNNPGQIPRLELSWPRNLNVDEELRDLNVEMIEDYVFPAIEAAGYDTDVYGSPGGAGGGDQTIMRNMLGLRHGVAMLIETFNSTPEARVELQLQAVHEVLEFHRERQDDVTAVVTEAPSRKEAAGESQSDPFYFGGADWDPPAEEDIIHPHACGYLINSAQAEQIEQHIELFSLETEKVSEHGVFVSMAQPMMTVIPLLLDERSASNEVIGKPLNDCSDPGSEEPPPLPPEPSPPAQYATDFSTNEFGEQPAGWTQYWHDSNWTVKEDPRRLHHFVDNNGNRRALTWDEVGDAGHVKGDVEVSGLVRASNTGDTLLQIAFHISDDGDTENAYYLDARKPGAGSRPNQVRIAKYQNGQHRALAGTELPFTVEEDTWYRVVLQREGDMLQAKMWPNGEEEPEAWMVQTYDTSFDQGRVGMSHFTSGAVNEWAFFGVGTGGEEAPRPPADILDSDPVVDKTDLQHRVDHIYAANLNEEDYTADSWQALQDALSQAKDVLDDPEVTQTTVDNALRSLNNAFDGLEESITASEIKVLVEQFEEEGAFANEEAPRALTLHLTAIGHYENQEEAEKVVRHLEGGFKDLLHYQHDNNLISDEAYDTLMDQADILILQWQ
ncbi:M14 family zinc carboxypeptidase [Virgibacillus sp. YIM 98842]|uniref:M14 family zinc carboxypeptidase n=1 Tax=Virgibacillus sp. YIM 98842 TaxID=2663533 RepID=UPI0013D9EFFC|nr:M14 family zinc carboxypeptidase [Virgibacillus sp. YIM 98842]